MLCTYLHPTVSYTPLAIETSNWSQFAFSFPIGVKVKTRTLFSILFSSYRRFSTIQPLFVNIHMCSLLMIWIIIINVDHHSPQPIPWFVDAKSVETVKVETAEWWMKIWVVHIEVVNLFINLHWSLKFRLKIAKKKKIKWVRERRANIIFVFDS